MIIIKGGILLNNKAEQLTKEVFTQKTEEKKRKSNNDLSSFLPQLYHFLNDSVFITENVSNFDPSNFSELNFISNYALSLQLEQNTLAQNILDHAYLANLFTPSNDKLDDLQVNPLTYIPSYPILYAQENTLGETSLSINPEMTDFTSNLFYPEHFV